MQRRLLIHQRKAAWLWLTSARLRFTVSSFAIITGVQVRSDGRMRAGIWTVMTAAGSLPSIAIGRHRGSRSADKAAN